MSTTLAELATTLQSVFTTEASDAADAAGLFRRTRKLTGPVFVQALTFGWLADPRASLGELADLAAELGADVSFQALDQRLTAPAADCLFRVLRATLLRLVQADPAADLLGRFSGIYVRDCSVITRPGARASAWPGLGHGNPDIPCTAIKLHLGLAALVALLGRLRERLRRLARKRGWPGRPTALEIVRAPGRYGWPVPPAGGGEVPGRQDDQESGSAPPQKRAEAA